MEVVASLSQGRTAAAQCGLFTHKSVPVIFEPPCITTCMCVCVCLAIYSHNNTSFYCSSTLRCMCTVRNIVVYCYHQQQQHHHRLRSFWSTVYIPFKESVAWNFQLE